MAKIKIRNVKVLSNDTNIFASFSFEIIFEAVENIAQDIEWRLIYVGNAESEKYDQTLDSVLVGPIPRGVHKFQLDTPGPKYKLLNKTDIVGLTIILITCHYQNQEFARIGYYVNNEYEDEELRENPPDEPKLDLLKRHIIDTDPRLTTFQIKWDDHVISVNE